MGTVNFNTREEPNLFNETWSRKGGVARIQIKMKN